MSSLERLPSDETDDGNVRLNTQEPDNTAKTYNPGKYLDESTNVQHILTFCIYMQNIFR